jgi:hypothetical protein
MTVETTLYIDEPIIQVTVQGHVDESEIEDMQQEVATACNKLGICFIIIDVRQAQVAMQEVLGAIVADNMHVDYQDEKIHVTVVSGASSDDTDYPIFADLDTALNHVRQEIAAHASKGGET